MSINDFKNICRICMINCELKFNLNNLISEVFYKITNIHFEINDDLPQQICLKCIEKINEIHEFSLLCKQTHFNLISRLNNLKNAGQDEINETNDVVKIEDITIDEHNIEFDPDENINSRDDYVTDEFETNVELEKNVTIDGQNPEIVKNIPEIVTNIPETIEINKNQNINSTKKSNGKQYKCNVCFKAYHHLRTLRSHFKLHTGDGLHKCDQCPKSFAQLATLKIHMLTHSNERPYRCEECSKSFTHASTLKSHMVTHSGERPHKCDQCSKSFTQCGNLKIHMRTHSGERPYKCDQCPMSFIRSGYLGRHKLVHTGERPYKCGQCTRAFTISNDLTKHMRWHRGERPFKCELCSKSFLLSALLKRHMIVHSGKRSRKLKTNV